MTTPESDVALALRLCVEAGRIAARDFGATESRLGMRLKPGGQGPVTRTDLEIDRFLTEALAAARPDDVVITEEATRQPPAWTGPRTWYIDPIDGTREFARGRAGWVISIGLCREGEPIVGALCDPVARWTAWASREGAAWHARQRVGAEPTAADDPDATPLSCRPPPDAFLLAAGAWKPFSRAQAIRRRLEVPAARVRRVGSVAARMAMIARGTADAYVQAPGRLKRWDTCAAHALVCGAGGVVTDLRGDPLRYAPNRPDHRDGIVVAPPLLHARLLSRLSAVRSRWLPSDG